jgi:intracellular sulfur oxidation DsrE/DsrF family protein
MNYEEYLDEVTTLITEHYNLSDAAAIKLVMDAQAADFFVRHDADAALRNQAQAELDAASIFKSAP